MSEKELAQKFVDYLSGIYDLYYEVYDIDIVGKAGSIIVAIEVKKHLNFKVIEQAQRNIDSSHYSYIAVPLSSARNNRFGLEICETLGIGVLVFDDKSDYEKYSKYGSFVTEKIKPKLNRHARASFAKYLNKDSYHKRATPGAKSGETITAFSVTVENLESYVRRNQGCEIKEALNGINHHYGSISSARSCIIQYIDSGVIKNIKRERGRLFCK